MEETSIGSKIEDSSEEKHTSTNWKITTSNTNIEVSSIISVRGKNRIDGHFWPLI